MSGPWTRDRSFDGKAFREWCNVRSRRSRWSFCSFGLSSLFQEGLLRMGFTGHFKSRSAHTMLCPHPRDGVLVSCAVRANEFRDVFVGDVAAEKG